MFFLMFNNGTRNFINLLLMFNYWLFKYFLDFIVIILNNGTFNLII